MDGGGDSQIFASCWEDVHFDWSLVIVVVDEHESMTVLARVVKLQLPLISVVAT